MISLALLALVTLSSCAKLDRTYLPPQHASTSGGSDNTLQTPNFRNPQELQNQESFPPNGNELGNNNFGTFSNQGPNNIGHSIGQPGRPIFGNDFSNAGQKAGQPESPKFANDLANTNNIFESVDVAPNADGLNAEAGFNNERPERPQAAFERNAAILRGDNQNDGDTYSYAFETENGISVEEHGVATNGVEAQGGYSYTGDDGKVYTIRYTADQNGFVPQGDHLPTAPPVPEEILRALEQNARDEAAGIFDDGSYDASKYDNSNHQQPTYSNNAPTENFGANNNNIVPNQGGLAFGNTNINQEPNSNNGFPEKFYDFNNAVPTNNEFSPNLNNFNNAIPANDDVISSMNDNAIRGNTEAIIGNKPFNQPIVAKEGIQEIDDAVITTSADDPSFKGIVLPQGPTSTGFEGPAYLPPENRNRRFRRRLVRRF